MELQPHRREGVLPLPVVLISTISPRASSTPPPGGTSRLFCGLSTRLSLLPGLSGIPSTISGRPAKFVVNVPTAGMSREVMVCARNYPPEIDEFAEAHLIPRPSKTVRPPGIEGCIAWMECSLVEEICRDRYMLVIGKVKRLEGNDLYFNAAGEMDPAARPLCMICGNTEMQFAYPAPTGHSAAYAEMFLKKDRI